MSQIGNVKEIQAVKIHLDELKVEGLITNWEFPYENLITRLSAAIFFFTLGEESKVNVISSKLAKHGNLCLQRNEEQNLSKLEWRFKIDKL